MSIFICQIFKMALRRIAKDLSILEKANHPEYTAHPVDDSDMFHWVGIIQGPKDSPYEGGKFKINITIPADYPLRAPTLNFITKIYHPNVSEKGEVCLEILKSGWTPMQNLEKILEQVYFLICNPDPLDALNTEIASEMKNNKAAFEEKAKKMTQEFAMEK